MSGKTDKARIAITCNISSPPPPVDQCPCQERLCSDLAGRDLYSGDYYGIGRSSWSGGVLELDQPSKVHLPGLGLEDSLRPGETPGPVGRVGRGGTLQTVFANDSGKVFQNSETQLCPFPCFQYVSFFPNISGLLEAF